MALALPVNGRGWGYVAGAGPEPVGCPCDPSPAHTGRAGRRSIVLNLLSIGTWRDFGEVVVGIGESYRGSCGKSPPRTNLAEPCTEPFMAPDPNGCAVYRCPLTLGRLGCIIDSPGEHGAGQTARSPPSVRQTWRRETTRPKGPLGNRTFPRDGEGAVAGAWYGR